MNSPKVTVICLSHNHEDYVAEAVQSVLDQSYPNTELVIVDDGSTDGSKQVITNVIKNSPIKFIDNEHPQGNCKAFNKGLESASGEYIIDLAADDILLPNRIEEGINTFVNKSIGVEFCNVQHVDSSGAELHRHFLEGQVVPEGDLYEKLITTYFISPPSMMIKRAVLQELHGYDERLSYEDFDFWIRSSRNHEYGYTDQVLVKKRDLMHSLGKRQFDFQSKHQKSTLAVCQKIKKLNKYKREDMALRQRCLYEIRNCLKQGNIQLIPAFLRMVF